MRYDFDTVIDRSGTGCIKFDEYERRGKDPGLLSLWVADMDFRAPDEVLDVLHTRIDHGVFGYTDPDAGYLEAVGDWFQGHYGWRPRDEWYVVVPGVVYACAAAVRAFTQPGEAVLIQQPVYYPFSEVILDNDRRLVNAPLVYDRERCHYKLDFDAFERAVVENDVRLFLLCNPHNPGGRVWTAKELRRLGEICLRHGVVVVSDEIHADFARPGFTHQSFAALSPELAAMSVTCTSASKTFNIAGLQVANVVIPNPDLRARFSHANAAAGYSQANVMGLVATEACYRRGGEWLCQLKDYLEGNFRLVRERIDAMPGLRMMEPESTYLVWIDCRELCARRGLDDAGLTRLVEDEARLWLDMGDIFGADGSGFVRINVASPRSVIAQAMDQLDRAVAQGRAGL